MFGALVVIPDFCTCVVSVAILAGVVIGTDAVPDGTSVCVDCGARMDVADDDTSLFIIVRFVLGSFIGGDFEPGNKSMAQNVTM